MPNPSSVLLLKRDRDIKQALVKQLDRSHVVIGEGGNDRYDYHSWREMIVSSDPQANHGAAGPLPLEILEGDSAQVNLLFADVVEFCPVPLAGWQAWAKDHLENHRKSWLAALRQVQEKLESAPMCAIPFGRFASGNRADDWVSTLKTVDLAPDEAFENWSENADRGFTTAKIWYFTRPYIIWPGEGSGANYHHVTHIQGVRFDLKRPSLDAGPKMAICAQPLEKV